MQLHVNYVKRLTTCITIYGQVMAVALNFFFSASPASTDVLFAGDMFDDVSITFCCCQGFSVADKWPGWLSWIFCEKFDVRTLESPQLAETVFDSDTADCFKL